MRYLVDGYNVVKADPATRDLEPEAQREALVARLAVRGRDMLGRGEIVVIFDGQPGGGPTVRRSGIAVRFSPGEPADEMIVRLVTGAGDAVVTSDGGLAARVRAAGGAVIEASACFEEVRTRRRMRYPARTVGVPPGAAEITRELEKLWLEDGE